MSFSSSMDTKTYAYMTTPPRANTTKSQSNRDPKSSPLPTSTYKRGPYLRTLRRHPTTRPSSTASAHIESHDPPIAVAHGSDPKRPPPTQNKSRRHVPLSPYLPSSDETPQLQLDLLMTQSNCRLIPRGFTILAAFGLSGILGPSGKRLRQLRSSLARSPHPPHV